VIDVGTVAFGVAVGGGPVWVADYCHGAIARIDPKRNKVVARIETRSFPRWLAFGAGRRVHARLPGLPAPRGGYLGHDGPLEGSGLSTFEGGVVGSGCSGADQ
jgi:hypothetical protein